MKKLILIAVSLAAMAPNLGFANSEFQLVQYKKNLFGVKKTCLNYNEFGEGLTGSDCELFPAKKENGKIVVSRKATLKIAAGVLFEVTGSSVLRLRFEPQSAVGAPPLPTIEPPMVIGEPPMLIIDPPVIIIDPPVIIIDPVLVIP